VVAFTATIPNVQFKFSVPKVALTLIIYELAEGFDFLLFRLAIEEYINPELAGERRYILLLEVDNALQHRDKVPGGRWEELLLAVFVEHRDVVVGRDEVVEFKVVFSAVGRPALLNLLDFVKFLLGVILSIPGFCFLRFLLA